MCIFCEQDAQTVGKFFGFPKCCINWFIEHSEKYGGGDKLHLTYHQQKFLKECGGHGFMPCPTHAKQINKKGLTLDKILVNRACSLPYPYEDDYTVVEFEEWLKINSI